MMHKQTSPSQPKSTPNTSKKKNFRNSSTTQSMEYNVIEDMKNTKENVSMYDICTLPQQRDLIMNTFKSLPVHNRKPLLLDTKAKTTEN
jgi:hypothetical protein